MRTRSASLSVLVACVAAACDIESTGPTALDPPAFQVDFQEETHFRCYIVSKQTPQSADTVILSDQFISDDTVTVSEPVQFCAPTSKNGEEVVAPEEHLTMYAAQADLTPHLRISTEDQFGERTLEAVSIRRLLVPTQKLVGDLEFPEDLDHYRCYGVTGEQVALTVELDDQFGTDSVRVERPHYFCNPVAKTPIGGVTEPILDEDVHLTCYEIFGPQRKGRTEFGIENQLEEDTFTITSFQLLCVPSEKVSFEVIDPPGT